MFDHVTIRASDREASERFYDLVLATVGLEKSHGGESYAEWGEFSLAAATDQKPITRRLHVAFVAPSHAEVDAFWEVGSGAGYDDAGPPGPRPQYLPDYYGSFLRDPDGNIIEAVHHRLPRTGAIDHLWMRVADFAAAERFYDTMAPLFGLHRRPGLEHHAHYSNGGSFTIVSDGAPATENVHLAFRVASDAAVEEFHRVMTAAGYRDNGAPGGRPVYHPGYYSAFVLDPDDNNVEAVNHNR